MRIGEDKSKKKLSDGLNRNLSLSIDVHYGGLNKRFTHRIMYSLLIVYDDDHAHLNRPFFFFMLLSRVLKSAESNNRTGYRVEANVAITRIMRTRLLSSGQNSS